MNNRLILTLAGAAVAAAVAMANDGNTKQYAITVGDFSALKVVEGVAVEYRADPDSAGLMCFTTSADKAALITFSNNKQTLSIELATEGVGATGLPMVMVYSRFLTKVENSGDSLVRIARVAPTPSFRVRLVGNGQISVRDIDTNYLDASLETGNGVIAITGKAAKAKYGILGVGSIQADDVEAVDVKCSMVGTGYVECCATGTLTVSGLSSGTVYYKGTPQIKNRAISAKVLPIDGGQ